MVKVYDRKANTFYTEEQYGEKQLKLLYHTIPGRILLKLYFSTGLYSAIHALSENTKKSAEKIPAFIEKNHIRMEDFEKSEYGSFGEFFIRKIKTGARPIAAEEEALIAPADAKLLVYPIDENTMLSVKGHRYSVEEIVKSKELAEAYKGGLCLVFRLSVDDYHRYCFIDEGKILSKKQIKGQLHTVSSLSEAYKIYAENQREYALLETKHFGQMIQMEVGAMQVGKIVNYPVEHFERGTEKGYFEFGGSTIILLLRADTATIESDILKMSEQKIETKVRYGERIGKTC